MIRTLLISATVVAMAGTAIVAQETHPLSPVGTASIHVLGNYVKPAGAAGWGTYQGGKWIDLTYGRPLKRGRNLWGSGATYGKSLLAGAPIWRAGADTSTRLKTEVPLLINGKTVPPGEYTIFIDIKENNWTFVVSAWAAQQKYDAGNKTALWGAYGYTPDKDVVRAPMKLETLPHSVEQLTWAFLDVSDAGASLTISWDTVQASVPIKTGN